MIFIINWCPRNNSQKTCQTTAASVIHLYRRKNLYRLQFTLNKLVTLTLMELWCDQGSLALDDWGFSKVWKIVRELDTVWWWAACGMIDLYRGYLWLVRVWKCKIVNIVNNLVSYLLIWCVLCAYCDELVLKPMFSLVSNNKTLVHSDMFST